MGYDTEFEGELKFTKELTASQLCAVNTFLDEDCRNHPEWKGSENLTYIDLEFNDDFSGLRWNGAEKTYDMKNIINLIIVNMQEKVPDFGLKGKLLCQGENIDDRYEIVIEHGFAVEKDTPPVGDKIICPYCKQEFYIEDMISEG